MTPPIVGAQKLRELAQLFARLGIREDDLLEKFIRASGPGGQKVNKTASAVYLKHLPSGMEVKVQINRSQTLNRYLARRLLAERVAAIVDGEKSAEMARIEKLRRQKRQRSRRAKKRMVADKREQGEKKARRARPDSHD